MSEELPSGWCWAALDSLFKSITDGDHQPPPQAPSGVPFLVIGDIRHGRVDLSDARYVSQSYFDSLSPQRKPAQGDLLYTVTGSFGIPVLVDTPQPFCVQRHIAILKSAPETPARYVTHALSTRAAFEQASQVATGTAQKTVGLKHLRLINVPLAPADERARIVEAVDSYLTRLDETTALLDRVQRNLKRYRASVLKAAVEGRLVPTEAELARAEKREYEPASALLKRILAERRQRWEREGRRGKYVEPEPPDTKSLPELPEGWCWTNLGSAFEVTVGATPSRSRPDFWGGGIPWVSSGEVAFCRVKTTRETITQVGLDNSSTKLNPPGTVLIGMIGEGRTRGQVAILDIAACNNQNAAAIRVADAGMSPEYVYYYLMSQYEENRQRGSGNNQPALNKARVQAIPLPLPPLAEQHRIVNAIAERISVADHLETTNGTTSHRCSRLRQSILKWAFEGKLVDQDPSDEPASALLARIKGEQPTTPAPKAPSRRRAKTTA